MSQNTGQQQTSSVSSAHSAATVVTVSRRPQEADPETPSTSVNSVTGLTTAPVEADTYTFVQLRKSKYNTKWKQQKNLAIRMDITVFQLFVAFTIIGAIFIGIGLACYFPVLSLPPPLRVEYTKCTNKASSSQLPANVPCFDGLSVNQTINEDCECQLDIEISAELANSKKLVMFYELENFHQNFRTYIQDIDYKQFTGKALIQGKAVKQVDCKFDHYMYENGRGLGPQSKYIFPCGKIANSYFSDTYELTDVNGIDVDLIEHGIAWQRDVEHFKNPKATTNPSIQFTMENEYAYPPDWHKDLRNSFWVPNASALSKSAIGIENEHFIVWIRTAALKSFRKKYAKIENLRNGSYKLTIQYRYEVNSFNGKKYFVIKGDSFDVPTDFFFFYMYAGVGGLCLVMGPLCMLIKFILKKCKMRRDRLSRSSKSPVPAAEDGLPQSSQNVTEGPSLSIVPTPQ